jgi:hypothetical protein
MRRQTQVRRTRAETWRLRTATCTVVRSGDDPSLGQAQARVPGKVTTVSGIGVDTCLATMCAGITTCIFVWSEYASLIELQESTAII